MVQLRDVTSDDVQHFFTHQNDPEASHMAAFTVPDPSDRAAFLARWQRILANPAIITRTIVVDGAVVGHILKFEMNNQPEVSYWIDKSYWNRGIATAALRLFLKQVTVRPLYARAAKDNTASVRVLEKCGFVITGHDTGFANARAEEIDEVLLTLR
jgi:RimJ/RimL family protein N-acetyltransferase